MYTRLKIIYEDIEVHMISLFWSNCNLSCDDYYV